MVRSSANRLAKYDHKLVGDVWKNRIDAHRDSMVAQETTKFGDLVDVEDAARAILNTASVSVTLLASYMAAAKRFYKIAQTHLGNIAVIECCIESKKWNLRGLSATILNDICLAATDVDISTCTTA